MGKTKKILILVLKILLYLLLALVVGYLVFTGKQVF